MQGSAKEEITNKILQRLPKGHIVSEDPYGDQSDNVIIGWMDAYGTTSIAEINFQPNLVNRVQRLIDSKDEAQLAQYMEKISSNVVDLSAKHDPQNTEPWVLNDEI